MTYNIQLNTVQKVLDFTNLANTIDGKLELIRGHHVVDAKSLLGILSLDLSQPIMLKTEQDILTPELDPFLV